MLNYIINVPHWEWYFDRKYLVPNGMYSLFHLFIYLFLNVCFLWNVCKILHGFVNTEKVQNTRIYAMKYWLPQIFNIRWFRIFFRLLLCRWKSASLNFQQFWTKIGIFSKSHILNFSMFSIPKICNLQNLIDDVTITVIIDKPFALVINFLPATIISLKRITYRYHFFLNTIL